MGYLDGTPEKESQPFHSSTCYSVTTVIEYKILTQNNYFTFFYQVK